MSDDLVKQACEWRENGSPPEPFYAVGHLIDAMAARIEELEAKLAAERERGFCRSGAASETVACHQNIAEIDAVACRHPQRGRVMTDRHQIANELWHQFKDRWRGEKKFALREIVKHLKGEHDAVDTLTDPDERAGS
jgi:hypothetical protein